MTTKVPFTFEIDFGASFVSEASVVVTGLTDMTTSAHIECFMQLDDTTAGNDATAHEALEFLMTSLKPTARVAATGFTAKAKLADGLAKGAFKCHGIYVV